VYENGGKKVPPIDGSFQREHDEATDLGIPC
jgi:hypothetical protein